MKLGFYSAILHDHPLIEALATVKKLGLSGYEINTGGFLPPVHVPIDNLLQNPESNTPPQALHQAARIAGINITER